MKLSKHIQFLKRFLIGILLLLSVIGCTPLKVYKTPSPSFYGNIDNTSLVNGYPKQKQTWVVFSDRENNRVSPTKEEDITLVYKELKFLEPLIVLKKRKGMFKVGEYTPTSLNDGKLTLKKGKIKVKGWIPQERLLLWSKGLRSAETGFATKAILTVSDPEVFATPNDFLENDSVIVYKTPNLSEKAKKRSIGDLVYIYKESADKEMLLIGKEPASIVDSIQSSVYGWVSKKMVSVWGERTAIQLPSNAFSADIFLHKKQDSLQSIPAISLKEIKQRNRIENIYPTTVKEMSHSPKEVRFLDNPFDYSQNKIYNILGNSIYYPKYKEILYNNRKLNLVFVLDGSENNRLYIPTLKSLLQELQLQFSKMDYFSTIRLAGVVYKSDNCGVSNLSSPLTTDYEDVIDFFDDKLQELKCKDAVKGQPVEQGILTATRLLYEAQAKDQTNMIVLVGTTASAYPSTGILADAITRVKARLICFQTQAKSDDTYNNFVLLAEKLVINSAKNISELKKEKIVNPQDVSLENDYSLSQAAEGIFRLDYPKQSMTQGYVIFPKKGEMMPINILKSSIDSLLGQITFDNKHIDKSLTTYFRSDIGVKKTSLYDKYKDTLTLPQKRIPPAMASGFLGKDNTFLFKGYLYAPERAGENGILLNEQEFEQLHHYYTLLHSKVGNEKEFNRRKAIRYYVRFVKKLNPTINKRSRGRIYKQTMAETIAWQTGMNAPQEPLMNRSLREWKNSKDISDTTIESYFNQYKILATRLITHKNNAKMRIKYNGGIYYWVGQEFVPKTMIPKKQKNESTNL